MTGPHLSAALDLETPLRLADGAGGITQTWRHEGRIWAEMRSGAGGERVAGVGVESTVTWRIVVRSAPGGDPRRPRAGQRLSMNRSGGVRRFLIRSVGETDHSGRYLMCLAHEEAGA